jgi:arginyl-tRNA synthetase
MSSRRGNVIRAVDVLETVEKAVQAETQELRRQIALGAVKYNFLKQRLGSDIAFDVTESVSLQGNSGPYLQYAHARARSILDKVPGQAGEVSDLELTERSLVRDLSHFSRVVSLATIEFLPHQLCTYLYELSQVFNRFYETNRVLDNPRQATRLALVERYADVLKQGLELLNIPTPEKM